jgi:hypothetical protein
MKRKIISSLLLLLLFHQVQAQLPDAADLMNKSREMTLMGSLGATISLTITEKNNSVRNRTISMQTKSYQEGTEKRMIRFIDPADVRGTSMLIIDNKTLADEMWIYLPALKKTRRIVSTEKGKSFMSSEFSNADMSSPTLSDFTNRHLRNSGENNQWIIESIPINEDKADEYGYSKKVTYLSADKYLVNKMEFYNFDNQLYKVIEIKAVLPGSNGRYLISDMYAKNLLNGRSSELKFANVKMDQVIDDSVFTIQNLEK